jgi:hypothetical protein
VKEKKLRVREEKWAASLESMSLEALDFWRFRTAAWPVATGDRVEWQSRGIAAQAACSRDALSRSGIFGDAVVLTHLSFHPLNQRN